MKLKNPSFLTANQIQQIISTNKAISYYLETAQLNHARKLFDEMRQRSTVSYNTMIAGYAKLNMQKTALSLFSVMHSHNVTLNESTASTVFGICGKTSSLLQGMQLHCLVLKHGLVNFELVGSGLLWFYAGCFRIRDAGRVFDELKWENELVWKGMVLGYVKCGLMSEALDVFIRMPRKDVLGWTSLISGFVRSGGDACGTGLEVFRWLMESGEVAPNEFTLDCVLRGCGKIGRLRDGRAVHGMLVKFGYGNDGSANGALIEFYCRCGGVDEARKVYDGMDSGCLNSSCTLIEGLIDMGRIEDAEIVFNGLTEMCPELCNLMIKGYAMCGRVEDSKKLFERMSERTIVSSNTMISLYSRNGEFDEAFSLFEKVKGERNAVTWNSMITGFIRSGRYDEGFELYVEMCRLQVEKTRSTFSVLFHACACLGSLQQGHLLHAHLMKTPFESNVYVGTSLVDMYSKCGSMIDARKSFIYISAPNVAAWTALLNGYGHHGFGVQAIQTFERMLKEGIKPNAATFVAILSACGRAGLVNEGMTYFRLMENYGVKPSLEHYACVVDLLGRSGLLKEAEEFINQMPIEADIVIWGALLSACSIWSDLEVCERVVEKMISLNPKQTSSYVIMSNIYAISGKWGKKVNARNKLKDLEVKKDRGCSWIELDRKHHVFAVEDRTHPSSNVIHATLKHLISHVKTAISVECGSLLKTNVNENAAYPY